MKPARKHAMGPKAVRGSDAARRLAALLLEAWSGVRSTQSASEAMGVAVTRFYQLEARALQMIVAAMEPRPRGRQRTAESELQKLKAEKQRLLRDVERYQSLYRTAQRALGIAMAKPPAKTETPAPGGKRRRGPRKKARGQAVAAELLDQGQAQEPREGYDGATEPGREAREETAGRQAGQAARRVGASHDGRAGVDC